MSRTRRRRTLVWLLSAALAALVVVTSTALGETNEQILSRRPLAPTNRAMVLASVYPDTPATQPATGVALSEAQARALLVTYEQAELPGNSAGQSAALTFYDNAAAKSKVPNHSLRAALAALQGTFAQGAMTVFSTT